MHNRPNASVWDFYEENKVIGHGMTGRVYMVSHKLTGEKYALKVSIEQGAKKCQGVLGENL